MTDRLVFDVVLDLTKAEAEAKAFQKAFDKPIKIKVTLDQKAAKAEAKAFQAEMSKISVSVAAKVSFNEAQVLRDVEAAVKKIERSSPRIKQELEIKGPTDRQLFAINARLQKAFPDIKKELEIKGPDGAKLLAINARLQKAFSRITQQLEIKGPTAAELLAINAKLQTAFPDIKQELEIKGPDFAELFATNAKVQAAFPDIKQEIKLDVDRDLFAIVTGAKNQNGNGLKNATKDVEGLLGALKGAPQAGAQIVGLGNNFSALGQSGGPIAAAAIAVTALLVVLSLMPVVAGAAGGAVATLGGVFAGFGVAAALELEPVINALNGLDASTATLAQDFSKEFGAIKGILAVSFIGTADIIRSQFFDPVNLGLANFAEALAPSINRSLGTLAPVLKGIADTFAGPLGTAVGHVTEAFARLVEKVLPIFTSSRVTAIFEQLAKAVDKSIPGLEDLAEIIVNLLEDFIKALPGLVEFGNALLSFARVVTSTIPLLQNLARMLSLLTAAFDMTPLAGLIRDFKNVNGSVQAGREVFLTAEATAKKFGETVGKVGSDFDAVAKKIDALNKKNLPVLSDRLLGAKNALADLTNQSQDGAITFDQLQSELNLLVLNLELTPAEIALVTKAWEEDTKAVEKQAKAVEKLQGDLDKLNTTMTTGLTFARLRVEQQVFFAEALRDSIVSVEEFNAVMLVTGLGADQVKAVFQELAGGVELIRQNLEKTIPTFGSVLNEIDLTTVAFGRRTEAVLAKLKGDLNTTLVFLHDIRLAQQRGVSDDLLTAVLSTGTFDQQRFLIRELAVGGIEQLKILEERYAGINKAQAFAGAEAEKIAKETGSKSVQAIADGYNKGKSNVESAVAGVAAAIKAGLDAVALPGGIRQVDKAGEAIGTFADRARAEVLPVIANINQAVTDIDRLSATVDVFMDFDGVVNGAVTVVGVLADLDSLNATIDVNLGLDLFFAQAQAVNQVLDQLDARVITIDVSTVTGPRKDGGPVWPGSDWRVNDGGRGREGIVDDRGFRMLGPEGYQRFDRPGVIIPAKDVGRYVDPMPSHSSAAVSTVTRSHSVTNKETVINVNGTGRDPMLVARRIARDLP